MSTRFAVICTIFFAWTSCIWSQPTTGEIPAWVTDSTSQLTVQEQPEKKDDPFAADLFGPSTQHIETTTSLPTSHSTSGLNNASPPNASDSSSATVGNVVPSPKPTVSVAASTNDPNTARVAIRQRQLERQNTRRCNNLGSFRLKKACRSITQEAFANTGYAYVMSGDTDVEGLKRDLIDQGQRRLLDTSPILPGIQNKDDAACPIRTQWMVGVNPNEHSLSPWAYKHHYDPNRIPQMMSVATCLCEGCIDPDIKGEFIENKNFVSKEITRYLRVLRRDNTVEKSYSDPKAWQESLEEIAIGCHCMRPKVL